jgi:RNA polymerase sigma-70 factor (ECF subfamily)
LLDDANLAPLIAATAARDREAFRRLYDAAAPRLFGIALRILGRRDLAEEATQDAFLSIWDQASRFDPERGGALAWMTVILRRRAIDRLRASPWLQREIADDIDGVDAAVSALPDTLALRQCLERLQIATRRAIVLGYLHGMSHQELSRALEAPLGTIKSRVRRGLAALRECLQL